MAGASAPPSSAPPPIPQSWVPRDPPKGDDQSGDVLATCKAISETDLLKELLAKQMMFIDDANGAYRTPANEIVIKYMLHGVTTKSPALKAISDKLAAVDKNFMFSISGPNQKSRGQYKAWLKMNAKIGKRLIAMYRRRSLYKRRDAVPGSKRPKGKNKQKIVSDKMKKKTKKQREKEAMEVEDNPSTHEASIRFAAL